MLDDSLLDDPGRLADSDGAGLLRSVALAGAQVRATAEAIADAGLSSLAETRPRALVLVTRPGVSPAVAELLAGLLGPGCPVPVVLADTVPTWVGALDVVLAHTEDPGDAVLAESVDRAARRGAHVVLTAPEDGPVAAAAAGRTLFLPPRIPLPAGFGFPRALAAGLSLVTALGLLRTDLDRLANELDREAERGHLSTESFLNPAKSLALRLAEHTPLLWGLDHPATAVARHAAAVLAGYTGVVCDVAGYPQALTRPVLHRQAVNAAAGADLFADRDEEQGSPLRVLLLAVRTGPTAQATRRAAQDTLPGAELLELAEDTLGDEVACAALLALRFEMAALYLGLAAGTLGGPGLFAPAAR